MLPEKGLSEQIAERFKSFFNYQPAIWHSGIKDKDKKKIWKGVFKNKIKLVLGARSAMFLPFQKLKLIIIDEEHVCASKQIICEISKTKIIIRKSWYTTIQYTELVIWI